MIDHGLTIAQSAAASGSTFMERLTNAFNGAVSYLDILNRPDDMLGMLSQIHIAVAGVLLVVGVLCVLNGYRWHKWVIVVCAFLCGFGMGYLMSRSMPQPYVVSCALALMAAVIATPLLRFSVAFFGGVTGAFIGANLWTALGLPGESILAGAGMGFILVGMASFIMFRHVVVLFTSIGGSAMAITGGLSLLLYVPQFNTAITNSIKGNQMLIPLLVTVAAVIGLVLQEGQKPAATDATGSNTASK